MTDPIDIPGFADVEAAAARINGIVRETPLLESEELNARVGGRVFLKVEALQRTGSFKYRGATNRLALIPDHERANGVVAFSSGNHAQGVAAAAQRLGLAATIVMPADAPQAKIAGTKYFGAEIVPYDRVTGDREAIAAGICAQKGATLIKPFDDAAIVAGQGTAGLEMARAAAVRGVKLDEVFVPCGGGGLVSGIALAFSGVSATTKITAVEADDYDGMGRSLAVGMRVAAPAQAPSMADALLSPMPGAIPFALALRCGIGARSVNDDLLAAAVSFAFRQLKLVVEPGGAAALALVLGGAVDTKDRCIGIVLSGGNGDPQTIAACCARALNP